MTNITRTTIPTAPVGEGESQKITFTAEQQAKVDEIIRDAMSRAGREGREAAEAARAEAQALRAELDAVKATVEPATGELETTKAELSKVRQQAQADKVRHALTEAARAERLIDPGVAVDLLQGQVRVNESGVLEVVTNANTPRLSADFTPMRVAELVKQFAAERPYLVHAETLPGTGASESNRHPRFEEPIEKYFGRSSSGALAQKLMKEDPAKYARLKDRARQLGLIG